MLLTLIHNPGAGDEEEHSAEHLQALVREMGHEVRYQSSDDDGWEDALSEPGELVVVAGGDGTVAKVARELSGKSVPMTVLPLGTANNIAKTFGLTETRFEQLAAGWSEGRTIDFDSGIASGPWGTRQFIEGVGTGLFARTMLRLDTEYEPTLAGAEGPEEELDAVLVVLRRRLQQFQPQDLKITLDGKDLSGNYLMLEAMNIRYLGPNLFLAPEAEPGDGLLDIVLLDSRHKSELFEYLSDHLNGELRPPGLRVVRGRHLQLVWEGFDIHIDDEAWPAEDLPEKASSLIDVKVLANSLKFLIPA